MDKLEVSMAPDFNILAINPGSTSNKIGLFKNETLVFEHTVRHEREELAPFKTIWEQYDFRLRVILDAFKSHPQAPKTLDAVVGRGGLLKPIVSGTYAVNDEMIKDARGNYQGEHASNLGCVLASDIAKEYGCKAFIVDPPSTCEFHKLAFYSGHPLLPRRPIAHALNIHAIARKAAKDISKPYNEAKFIVAHLGGGITIAAVDGGKMIDNNDATSEGPFTPERTGGMALIPFADLCFSGKYDIKKIKKMVMGEGGLVAYLGTNSAVKVEEKAIAGDKQSEEVYQAMVYKIAKEIGAISTVFCGQFDAIVLTGGIAYSDYFVQSITKRIGYLGKIMRYPGEDELEALAGGALRVLSCQEEASVYPKLGERPPEWNFIG